MPFRTALLLLAVLLPPSALGDLSEPTRPLAVVVGSVDGETTVLWVPGPEAPDAFRIYGLTHSGAPALLATVPGSDTQAAVPDGFDTYAVTALKGDLESDPTTEIHLPCVTVVPSIPPRYAIGSSCRPRIKVRSLP